MVQNDELQQRITILEGENAALREENERLTTFYKSVAALSQAFAPGSVVKSFEDGEERLSA